MAAAGVGNVSPRCLPGTAGQYWALRVGLKGRKQQKGARRGLSDKKCV